MGEFALAVADQAMSFCFKSGWDESVEGPGPVKHRWSIDNTALIVVPTPIAMAPITITLSAIPYVVPGQVDAQSLWVFANGAAAAFGRLSNPGPVVGQIPESVLNPRPSELTLSFVVPEAATPARLGEGQDQRLLGVALQSLVLTW